MAAVAAVAARSPRPTSPHRPPSAQIPLSLSSFPCRARAVLERGEGRVREGTPASSLQQATREMRRGASTTHNAQCEQLRRRTPLQPEHAQQRKKQEKTKGKKQTVNRERTKI